MEIVDVSPAAHFASFDDPEITDTLIAVDAAIRSALPGRARTVWAGKFWGGTEQTIVGYGHIRQQRPRGDDVEWFLVGMARQKTSYSLYLNAVHDGAYLAHSYEGQLGKVKLGAASIGFRKLDDLDLAGLDRMLRHADELTPPDPV